MLMWDVTDDSRIICIESKMALAETFANMSFKCQEKKEKERSEHEWKLNKLTTNSNKLLIEIRKNKHEVVMLKSRIDFFLKW